VLQVWACLALVIQTVIPAITVSGAAALVTISYRE